MTEKREITFVFLMLSMILIVFTINMVSGASGSNTAPAIGNIAAVNITETTITITFTVGQIDANTIIRYGTKSGSLT